MEHNQRQSFRAPIDTGHKSARLFTRRAEVLVFLVDESAGGFGIMTDLSISLSDGETVWLQTATGCSEARVVNSTMEVGAKRFGLQRLRDLPSDWHAHLARDLWPDIRVQRRLRPWIVIRRRLMYAGGAALLLVATTVAAFWDDIAGQVDTGALTSSWNNTFSSSGKSTGGGRVAVSAPIVAQPVSNATPKMFVPPPSFGSATNGPVVRIRAPSKNLGKVIFTLPRAARDIKLDKTQQTAIRGIVDEALKAVDSWAGSKPLPRNEQDRRLGALFDEAAKRVMTVLTPDQKARWKARMDQPVGRDQSGNFAKHLTTIEEILTGNMPASGGPKSKRSHELAKLLDEARVRAWVSLSAEQREQWHTLLGKSFSQ